MFGAGIFLVATATYFAILNSVPSNFRSNSFPEYFLVFDGFIVVKCVVVELDVEIMFVAFSSRLHKR